MSSTINEINTYFGRCRCCLNYGYLKNMWDEHYWKGEKEIYVEMLAQVFALVWEPSEASTKLDRICEECITHLRDAYSFKKTVLQSQMQLLHHNDEDVDTAIKIENISSMKREDLESEDTADNSIYVDEPERSQYEDTDDPDFEDVDGYEGLDPDDPDYVEQDDQSDMDYEDVEYLDDDKDVLDALQTPRILGHTKNNVSANNRKWLNKSSDKRTKTGLEACLEAVKNEQLTLKEASEKYNVPRKTIAAKLKQNTKENETKMEARKQIKQDKKLQFTEEIKTILSYTNATPYKSQSNRYCCTYCPNDSPSFDNAKALRSHTRKLHDEDRTAKIELVVPARVNEIVKFDIHELECIICRTSIHTWNDMFKHLKDKHEVILDQAYTKAIPYDLTDELQCALCKQAFSYYMHLDSHMNAHYNNYVCAECGDTFVAETRWRRHLRSHDVDKYACSICKQVFPTLICKNKHEESVHKELPKFKCHFCDRRFSSEYLRHLHEYDEHKDKVEVMTCDVCGKTFTWRPYYRKHKRQHENTAKKFECKVCGRTYFLQIELRDHMLRHIGQKDFTCDICNKKYVSQICLKRHLKRHKQLGDY